MTTTLTPGAKVRIAPTATGNVLAADFPGWGASNYADFLLPFADRIGMEATVKSVEMHGSNPWTRYCIVLADGTRASGAILDKTFVTA